MIADFLNAIRDTETSTLAAIIVALGFCGIVIGEAIGRAVRRGWRRYRVRREMARWRNATNKVMR